MEDFYSSWVNLLILHLRNLTYLRDKQKHKTRCSEVENVSPEVLKLL